MQRAMEFHDSSITGVESGPHGVTLYVEAYVHQWESESGSTRGTGWAQPVALRLIGAALIPGFEVPVDISDGSLRVDDELYDNWLPVPFSASGPVQLAVQLNTGSRIDVSALGVELSAVGEARYIEELPADMWQGE